MRPNSVEVRELRKVYRLRQARGRHRELIAVDDVSFDVAEGGSVAIVGESGSGKTTTARMILGLEPPTSGSIVVAGRPRGCARLHTAERKRQAREAQIVFQDPYLSLDPTQSVGSCLNEVLKFHFTLDAAARRERLLELLDRVGLDEGHERSLPRALSGGQRQRVAIARALAVEPRVLILDEAVSALDVSIQAQILNLLADLREQSSVSYIFISHDLSVVRQVSDYVLVMHDGKTVEKGPTAQIIEQPQHPYTQRLLAAVPRAGWKPSATSIHEV